MFIVDDFKFSLLAMNDNTRTAGGGGAGESIHWTPWRATGGGDYSEGEPWLLGFQRQAFRLLAVLAVGILIFISIRGIWVGIRFPWSDLCNAVLFIVLLILSFKKPQWVPWLCWTGLTSIIINAVDGLQICGVVPHSLILMPLLVLYGALLGDLWLSLAALIGVSAMYAYTWYGLGRLTGREMFIFTDVCLLTLFTAAAVLSVWLRHRRLAKELVRQAAVLREELDLRARLQAVITHDIRNPLMVLLNAADCDDPRIIQMMAKRVVAIVDSARDLAAGAPLKLVETTLSKIEVHLNDVFAPRLAQKGQTLVVTGTSDLVIVADVPILCNSVLGNILSNAIKFSPRGATITLTAKPEGDFVRLVMTDQGGGFPSDMFKKKVVRNGYHSKTGTEGERGTGYGLHIAALCAERLGGSIEIRNCVQGGAAVAVLLPRRPDATPWVP